MYPLLELKTHQQGVVRALQGGHRFMARMASLGFTPGAVVTMTRNDGFGPVIVSVRGTRVALGRGEANRVLVTSYAGGALE